MWIHGYSLDSSIWAEIWGLLPGWKHIGIDLPGHGLSRPLLDGEDLPVVAAHVLRVARDVGSRRVIAMSFGAMIAVQAAIADSGALIDSLVLGSPGLGGGPLDRRAQVRNLELARLYRERGPGPWISELWMRSPLEIFAGAARSPALWGRLRAVIDRHQWAELLDPANRQLANYPQPERALHHPRRRFHAKRI